MSRLIPALPALLLLAACSGFEPTAPRPEARDVNRQENVSIRMACREAADRTLARQDRSQLMREDERNSRLGAETSVLSYRAVSDQMGRQFRRDQLAADCERQNQQSAPDLPAAQPSR
jgi:hypothetical protein